MRRRQKMNFLRWTALFATVLLVDLTAPRSQAGDGPQLSTQNSIVIIGNVRNSTVTNAINETDPAIVQLLKTALNNNDLSDEKQAEAEKRAAVLATKLGFTSAAVNEFFKILGEQNVPEEKLPEKLTEIAIHFAQTQDALAALEPDDHHAAELAAQAKVAFSAGHLEDADTLLNEAELSEQAASDAAKKLLQKVQAAVDHHTLNLATMQATQGDIALTRLNYAVAAVHFDQAASIVSPTHADKISEFREREANALYTEGNEYGRNDALMAAIKILTQILQTESHARDPLGWAANQNSLGVALFSLGDRESGTYDLWAAVTAYRAALQEYTPNCDPINWTGTQNNLGNALDALGERQSGTTELQAAVTAYQAALQGQTRDRDPRGWAATQNNLGIAFFDLGERESDTTELHAAVTAYQAALQQYTPDRDLLNWAVAQNNLGNALVALGERESGTTALKAAVTVFKAVLQEETRERDPRGWAGTQNNLGSALVTLGKRESGTTDLEAAVTAFQAVMQENTRDYGPYDWAMAQYNLGLALLSLGERESGTTDLQAAVTAWNACLTVATTSQPATWAQTVRLYRDIVQAEIQRRTATKTR